MRTVAAAATLLLAHCAPADTATSTRLAAEGARECIDMGAVTSRTAEDGRTIRFDMIGGAIYRNRLPGRCPGLRRSSRGFGTLAFDVHGNRLCRGDLVRVIDPAAGGAGTGAYRSAVPCPLGTFVPAGGAPDGE